MRALVTGASGTVGRALAARLVASGTEVVPWYRSRVPIDRYQPMEDFVRATRVDVVYGTRWLPACSFLDDTAAALERLATVGERGLYMIDSNVGWTHFEIAHALAEGAALDWRVVRDDDGFAQDQRMIDPRLEVPPLRARLPSLPAVSPIA